jgi:dipeptidyl aminopeptidase/acylaminoacyl peptidase
MRSTPWERRDRYVENSPYFYLDRVTTPLLLIHGSEDDATPVYGSRETFTALRRLGKAVEYVEYDGAPHNMLQSAPQHQRLDYYRRILDWFDTYLLGASSDTVMNAQKRTLSPMH